MAAKEERHQTGLGPSTEDQPGPVHRARDRHTAYLRNDSECLGIVNDCNQIIPNPLLSLRRLLLCISLYESRLRSRCLCVTRGQRSRSWQVVIRAVSIPDFFFPTCESLIPFGKSERRVRIPSESAQNTPGCTLDRSTEDSVPPRRDPVD
jgi:hypothetical protein